MIRTTVKRAFDTPTIHFDRKNGSIQISGRSIQLDPNQFWKPVIAQFKEYLKHPKPKTSIRFELEYINTPSIEAILKFLKVSKEMNTTEQAIDIEWRYEKGDDDMMDLGNSIHRLINIPMQCTEMN